MPAPVSVAWISDFPLEWLPDLPEPLQALPRLHPLSWQRVLLGELETRPNVRVDVLALRKGLAQNISFSRHGVTYHVLKVPGGLRAPSFFWIDTLLLGRALRRINPQVVHAWGTERGAGLIASRLGFPYLVTIQGLLGWYGEVISLSKYERFAAMLERVSLRRAKFATTESKFAVRYLEQRYPKLKVRQIEHASNWLFHKVQRAPQTKPLRFLYIGTLEHRKGTDLLLRALDRLTPELDFEVRLIGSIPDPGFMGALQRELSPAFWSRIVFKANLTPEEVAQELSVATCLVFPTRADTSPNAVKEAVVAGLPVVASEIGGIPDYVIPGENGFIFKSGDLEGMVQALRSAVAHPLFSQGLVSPGSLGKSRQYLSPARMGEGFAGLYEEIRNSRQG